MGRQFKAGDVVEVVNAGEDFSIKNGERHTLTQDVDEGEWIYIESAKQSYRPERFRLVQCASPVRTVTRKEIVPGKYGDVTVTPIPFSGFEIEYKRYANAASLRAAAATFIELADALEEGV